MPDSNLLFQIRRRRGVVGGGGPQAAAITERYAPKVNHMPLEVLLAIAACC
jgi:hypothetical protein